MEGICKKNECGAPRIRCHLLQENYTECEFWVPNSSTKTGVKGKKRSDNSNSIISWSGETFKVEDISQVSVRGNPTLIGLVGRAEAGKSSFLGMLYTLLLNGKQLKNFDFAGTKTVLGWEKLAHTLRLKRGTVSFPEPTPSNPDYYSFVHLALRNSENRLKDVLFTDTSGELFLQWSHNIHDESADSARWIHQNSSGFILFVDCEALIERRNAAKTEIIDITQQLKQGLKGRPVMIVWSKADRIGDVKNVIRSSLHDDLNDILPESKEIEISNFSKADPDEFCHENNLEVIDWLLEQISQPSDTEIELKVQTENDWFFNFRG